MSTYFLPYQQAWILDASPLKIIEKSRQIGISYADAYDSVIKASRRDATLDVWVSSRDRIQARLYLEDCRKWAKLLDRAARFLGEIAIENEKKKFSAYVLEFASRRRIYALSSNVDAIAGKHGHIKLDEYALHRDQRDLYAIAMPAATWGGQISIISTHRGIDSRFNKFIRDIKERGNPMGWSHHRVSIHDAVAQGLVEKINEKKHHPCSADGQGGRPLGPVSQVANGQAAGISSASENPQCLSIGVRPPPESRDQFLQRMRATCVDEEQWTQEFCCIPSDENSAFITYDMIDRNLEPNCLRPFSYLSGLGSEDSSASRFNHNSSRFIHHASRITNYDSTSLYLGVDVARKHDLCVIDVGEKIGDVIWDRLRIELQNKTFSEIESRLYPILALPTVRRACIDATGIGAQLAERARQRFGWKVEPVVFTAAVKEDLAFNLRHAFEDRLLRIDTDQKLHGDLRGIKKEVTSAGNIRFVGESEDSHCDRFWAMAFRQHAARHRKNFGAIVIE